MPELSKTTPLTAQQKNFIKYYIETRKVGDSALRAGINRAYGSRLLHDQKISTAIAAAMEKKGITDDFLSDRLKEGLESTYAQQLYKDGKPKQEACPDFHTRKEYLDLAFKLRGDYAPQKSEILQKTVTLNVNLDMVKGLADSGAITAAELDELKAITEGKIVDAEVVDAEVIESADPRQNPGP